MTRNTAAPEDTGRADPVSARASARGPRRGAPHRPADDAGRPFPGEGAITRLLLEARAGEASAMDRIVDAVYDHLRAIAHRQLRRERSDHTLGTTALVHEAYLRLVDQTRTDWRDRRQFFAVAARVMRRILVDHARKHLADKRGGGWVRTDLDGVDRAAEAQAETLVAVDEALSRLSTFDPRLGRLVEYRFFAGLSESETAELLELTPRTVRRDWARAKGWLYRELTVDAG